MPDLPEVRGSFGPRENFYLVFAVVAGVLLLVLTIRDAVGGVVGAPAVGLVVVTGLAFLIVFGGSDRQEPPPEAGDPAEPSPAPPRPGEPGTDAERPDTGDGRPSS